MHVLILTLHLTAQGVAGAQSISQENYWSAWKGCWRAEGAPPNESVCITPDAGGVRIATLVGGTVRDESRIIADGVARRVNDDGCTGTERAHWSTDGQRVFLDSDVTCDGSRRSVRGMFTFIGSDEWVSVQTASSGDSVATRVVRFIATDGNRAPALFAIDESDVSEAVEIIGAAAVQEWMHAAGEPFQLSYQDQGRAMSSALEQVGRLSNPVVEREVVRVVERPVYVHTTTYITHPHYHYSPWGHHHHGWRWSYRPVVVVRLPIVIHRNHHYRRDHYSRRTHYARRDYDNYRRDDRYDRDRRYDRDDDRNRGRVTRTGYSAPRDKATPRDRSSTRATADRARAETREQTRANAPRVTRERDRSAQPRVEARRSSGTSRAQPQRGNGSSRAAVTRTARSRSSRN